MMFTEKELKAYRKASGTAEFVTLSREFGATKSLAIMREIDRRANFVIVTMIVLTILFVIVAGVLSL